MIDPGSTSPPEALCGGISQVNFQETLSSCGDKCPQNGSKNGLRAPRTGMGCPHIGPSVGLTRREDALIWDRSQVVYHRVYEGKERTFECIRFLVGWVRTTTLSSRTSSSLFLSLFLSLSLSFSLSHTHSLSLSHTHTLTLSLSLSFSLSLSLSHIHTHKLLSLHTQRTHSLSLHTNHGRKGRAPPRGGAETDSYPWSPFLPLKPFFLPLELFSPRRACPGELFSPRRACPGPDPHTDGFPFESDSRCCIRIRSAMVGVLHRPLLPSLSTGWDRRSGGGSDSYPWSPFPRGGPVQVSLEPFSPEAGPSKTRSSHRSAHARSWYELIIARYEDIASTDSSLNSFIDISFEACCGTGMFSQIHARPCVGVFQK